MSDWRSNAPIPGAMDAAFPREPRDDIEREAVETRIGEAWCGAHISGRRGICTRRPHDTGDHVAATAHVVLARWPATPRPAALPGSIAEVEAEPLDPDTLHPPGPPLTPIREVYQAEIDAALTRAETAEREVARSEEQAAVHGRLTARIAYLEAEEARVAEALRPCGWQGVTCGPDEAIRALLARADYAETALRSISTKAAEYERDRDRNAELWEEQRQRAENAAREAVEAVDRAEAAESQLADLRRRCEALRRDWAVRHYTGMEEDRHRTGLGALGWCANRLGDILAPAGEVEENEGAREVERLHARIAYLEQQEKDVATALLDVAGWRGVTCSAAEAIRALAGASSPPPREMQGEAAAGECSSCGGPVYHRPGRPGEYDHRCAEEVEHQARAAEQSRFAEDVRAPPSPPPPGPDPRADEKRTKP